MNQLRKILSTLLLSVILFAGILAASPVLSSVAAILPDEAQDIIKQSDSVQEAGDRLRAGDSYQKVKNRETLNTAKEVTDRVNKGNQRDNRDVLISSTENKLKEAVENVKEKLNLDEPLAPSTKEFLGKRQEEIESNGDVVVREEPGYYQRNRQSREFVEEGAADNYKQEIHE